jgi:hypothetical protein
MPTEVINTVSLTKNPEFKNVKTINKNFKNIKKEHCNSLLEFLYNGGLGKWQNPFTKKFLSRESPIIISFLSRCYNMSDDSKINIHGCNLTYKKHIDKFINNEYLYVPFKKKSTNSKKSNINTQSVHKGVSHRNSLRNSLRSNQVRRHNNSTIDTGSSLHFNYGGTWQPPYINTVGTSHPVFKPHLTQPHSLPFTQTFGPSSVQNSYTYQPPYHDIPHHQSPHNHIPHNQKYSQQPNFKTELQRKQSLTQPFKENFYESHEGKYYESSGNKYYQRNIPDDIWQLIEDLGGRYINYMGPAKKDIIEKLNNKYTDDQELFARWKKEEEIYPDKVKKEKKKYKSMEESDKFYLKHKVIKDESNGKKILNAKNGFFEHFF